MNALASVANQTTGLFIGIFTAEQHAAQYGGVTPEAAYIVRDNGSGYLETEDLDEAVAEAIEWAQDAKDNSPADATALDDFVGTDLAALVEA